MGAAESLIASLDQVIEYFNKRKLDLPDDLFDRKTQFLVNGATFESLLSATPNDPLVLMLARGPAGYRFTIKALQHAMPDAKIERGDINTVDPSTIDTRLWLSGKLRGTAEAVNAIIALRLRLNQAGLIEVADATIDGAELEKIRAARLRA